MTFQYFFFDTYCGYFLQMVPFALLAAVLCLLGRRIFLNRGRLAFVWPREWTMALYTAYLTGLFLLLLMPNNLINEFWYRIFYHQSGLPDGYFSNLPLWDISRWVYSFQVGALLPLRLEALGNILLFLPFGCFLPLLWPGLIGRTVPYGFCVSLCVEVLQMPLGRSFDARDLLMNTLGTAVGLLICVLFRALFPKTARSISSKKR